MAKWKALNMLRGSVQEHYAKLRGYKAELLRVDKEGRFDFLLDEDCTFKGFFIGFNSLRKWFLKGCRPIIGFDGCFLKTFLGGALLCAVAKDGNNQMFSIFWAVVECENESMTIIDMLEEIKCALMERMHSKLMHATSLTDFITPRIRTKLEEIKYNSRLCTFKPAVGGKFQVNIGDDQFVDSATFVDKYYSVETYIETYKNAFEPLNGRKMWPQADGLPIKTLKFKKMPGRPKKNMKRDITEDPKNPNKLSRQGIQMTCAVCGGVGAQQEEL
eukprot:XP_015570713.1 uncharacterized protein LOC107260779 [Ricinus communis]